MDTSSSHLIGEIIGLMSLRSCHSLLRFSKRSYFADSTVYVATDAGVATSSDGKRWRAITDTAGTHLIMERLAVDGTNVYGASETSVYQLEGDGVSMETDSHRKFQI